MGPVCQRIMPATCADISGGSGWGDGQVLRKSVLLGGEGGPVAAGRDEITTTGQRPGPLGPTGFDIVGFAASAGGVNALMEVLGGLPADFPAAVIIVQHLDPRHRSLMAEIIGRHSELKVKQAEENDKILPGCVYIAPPNLHLLISRSRTLTLTDSEMVHFVRPSADLLFESLATAYRDRAIAVVLSGSGADGSMGVTAVKKTGGTVIAQDQATSEFYGMPGAAVATGNVDFVLPLDEIAGALVKLVKEEGK
jgi:two-component system, chemotaxis family, protein-glutamate methylesterase/glutaminase